MEASEFDAAMSRIQGVTKCYTQTDLADFFGIRQSSISDANKRKSIPAKWLLILVQELDINPEWIITGDGPQYLHEFSATSKQKRPKLQSIPNTELLGELARRIKYR